MFDFRRDVLPLKNRLYRIALRITQHTAESEDIVQETLIRVWNHRDELSDTTAIESFSVVVCRHLALDYIARKESQNAELSESSFAQADPSASPFQQLSAEDGKQWVYKIFCQLPEKQRTVIQLRDIEGKSYKEIASFMQITEEQVKVTLFRARQKVKLEFEKIDNYGL